MRCRLIGCGTANQTQSAMQSGTPTHRSRSHRAVIRFYDEAGNVIETHEHASAFKEPQRCMKQTAATR
jgi:hypothetical protein